MICSQGHPMTYRGRITEAPEGLVPGHGIEGAKEIEYWVCPQEGEERLRDWTGEAPPLCDFCSAPYPSRSFACKSFLADIVVQQGGEGEDHWSLDEWAACGRCAAFIDANDQPGLSARCVRIMAEVHHMGDRERVVATARMSRLHKLFFANRIPGKEVSR